MDQSLIIDSVLLYLHSINLFEARLFGVRVFPLKLSQLARQSKISLQLLFYHPSFYKSFNVEAKQRKITCTKIKRFVLTHRQCLWINKFHLKTFYMNQLALVKKCLRK